jgi:hypothetical protein
MTNWLQDSTIARFHQERHAKMTPPSQEQQQATMKAHPHPTTFESFARESHIYKIHEDRHHGVIHATSPATGTTTLAKSPFSWTNFCNQSTIQKRHEARHVLIGVSP